MFKVAEKDICNVKFVKHFKNRAWMTSAKGQPMIVFNFMSTVLIAIPLIGIKTNLCGNCDTSSFVGDGKWLPQRYTLFTLSKNRRVDASVARTRSWTRVGPQSGPGGPWRHKKEPAGRSASGEESVRVCGWRLARQKSEIGVICSRGNWFSCLGSRGRVLLVYLEVRWYLRLGMRTIYGRADHPL